MYCGLNVIQNVSNDEQAGKRGYCAEGEVYFGKWNVKVDGKKDPIQDDVC